METIVQWNAGVSSECLCLLSSKKDDKVAVPVRAQKHERYHPTPPHPQSSGVYM